MRSNTAAACLLALIAAVGCSCSNGQNANTGTSTNSGNNTAASVNTPGNANNKGGGLQVLLGDPWKSAAVGDTAVYRTPQSDEAGETWELLEGNLIKVTRSQGLDPFGEPDIETSTVPAQRDEGWWTLPQDRRKPVAGEPVTLADGTTLETNVIKGDGVTWLISKKVPFDGVVRETRDGQEQPVRELMAFTRAGAD